MKTNTRTAILIVTAGIAQFACAGDYSPRERSSSESSQRSMSGSRDTVPFHTVSGAGVPSFSSQTGPAVRATRNTEQTRATGVSAPTPIRSVPYAGPSLQQQTTASSTSSRDASRVSARAAVQTVRQPDATASYTTRDASRAATRSAVQARQPEAAVTTRDRDSSRTSTQPETADGIRTAHSRWAGVAQARSTQTGHAAPVLHEAMDGRSESYRTSMSPRTSTTSSDGRRDLRSASLSTPRPSATARLETADRIASRTATSDRNRFSSALNIHSPSMSAPPHAVANRSIAPTAPRSDHQPRPSSFTQRPAPYAYHHDTYRSWRYPTVYPTGWGLLTWSSRSFFSPFSAAYYAPVFTYADYSYWPGHTRWHDRYYSSSYVFYGGWQHGWYGGFSYVCNPWPVYSTYYFCDPPAVVTRTETVYVTQPAVAAAPTTDAASSEVGSPSAFIDPAVSNATATAAVQAIPADLSTTDLLSAYDTEDDDFTLDFASYAETMDAERIWSSYSGLDGSDPYEDMDLNAETAAITSP